MPRAAARWATLGFSVFVQGDRLVVDYNAFDDHSIVESDIVVPAGDSVLTARFRRGDGRSGSLAVAIDGTDAGRADVRLFMRMISSVGASVGFDHGSAISTRYRGPFAFTGTLHEVEIQLVARGQADAAEAEARAAMSRQ